MEIVCYDTETTSEKPQSCRVVQLGSVVYGEVSGGITEEVLFNEICDPGLDDGYEPTKEAEAIHGISTDRMRGARRDTAVMREFYDVVKPAVPEVIFAGHAITRFDFPILYRVAECEPFENPRIIDTLVLAQRLITGVPNHKLGTLVEHLGLGSNEDAHDAVGDCRMVFRLVQFLSQSLGRTWLQLAQDCATPRVHTVCGFGKHKGKLWGRKDDANGQDVVPWYYVKWMQQNFTDASDDMVVTLWYHYKLRMTGFDEVMARVKLLETT